MAARAAGSMACRAAAGNESSTGVESSGACADTQREIAETHREIREIKE
jgi:hypothetical protein